MKRGMAQGNASGKHLIILHTKGSHFNYTEDSSGPHKAPNRRIAPARFIVIRKKYGARNTSCYARSECSRPNRLFLR